MLIIMDAIFMPFFSPRMTDVIPSIKPNGDNTTVKERMMERIPYNELFLDQSFFGENTRNENTENTPKIMNAA